MSQGVGVLLTKDTVLSTIVRNTSCERGWLRLVVQIIFGTLIVSSFILILLMVLKNPNLSNRPSSRCQVNNCRVTCNDAPFYERFEDDIINAALRAESSNCQSIAIELYRPVLVNSKIPKNWLSRIRGHVHELSIIGGNIKEIPSEAFASPFNYNVRVLTLTGIEISVWESNMLIGLFSLQKLYIQYCTIHKINSNALMPVDDSLNFIDIKANNIWDPVNITGTARLLQLNVVDFSSNNFNSILDKQSFSKIKACRILYLNSCRIVSIGSGTFDNFLSIEALYLNDNFLVTVPGRLFDRILPFEPRIALENNIWYCDCNNEDLRRVIRKELLIVDPVCFYPDAVAGMTFSDFEVYCNKKIKNELAFSDHPVTTKNDTCIKNVSKTIYINGACHRNKIATTNTPLEIISPFEEDTCLLNKMKTGHEILANHYRNYNGPLSKSHDWIKAVCFVQNNAYSLVEIALASFPGYGFLWYQTSCLTEVYCLNNVPHTLKIFNVNLDTEFTFCLFNSSISLITSFECVSFKLATLELTNNDYYESNKIIIMYIFISIGCLICGAACVYVLIQRNPSLLKGSKRVLFVKHKTVEALVLPPNLPMRNKLFTESNTITRHIYEKQKIFVLPQKGDKLSSQNFARSVSMRSNDSNDASYISALQPTEEQLTEWRTNQMLKRYDNISHCGPLACTNIKERDSLPYYSVQSGESIYEVPVLNRH